MDATSSCSVCNGRTQLVGTRKGILDGREFFLYSCTTCHFAFIQNYRTDFERVYDRNYYCGLGADRLVNYTRELYDARTTVRNYEWEGVTQLFKQLCPAGGLWLDYGCGVGGLVKYALQQGTKAAGFELGVGAELGREARIPILRSDELDEHAGKYDFISAVEVLEHVPKPIDTLIAIRKLLKPGGVLFLTTGNSQPWRENLLSWSYTMCPDVHISFYEPETIALCLKEAGFTPAAHKFCTGFKNIIKYKVLKNLRVKNKSRVIDLLPWDPIARAVDLRYRVSAMPYGVAV